MESVAKKPHQQTPLQKMREHAAQANAQSQASQGQARHLNQQSNSVAPNAVPSFAQVPTTPVSAKDIELHRQASRLIVLLTREKFFLYVQWAMFVITSLTGLFISYKCYSDFQCDHFTKMVMSSIPFVLINMLGLAWLDPICRTKQEIVGIKEKLSSIKFKIEYGHLL